jgi:hypothetical protein
MATYSKEDFDRIAAAIGKHAADVAAHQEYFENAAFAFRLDRGLPSPDLARSPEMRPYQMRLKVLKISKSAQRLLKNLGVRANEGGLNIEDAYDGPGNFEILKVLSWAVDHDEDPVITATRRVGRLAEILKAVDASTANTSALCGGRDPGALLFELLPNPPLATGQGAGSKIAARKYAPKEYQGDVAVNNWIAAMLSVYKRRTGISTRDFYRFLARTIGWTTAA